MKLFYVVLMTLLGLCKVSFSADESHELKENIGPFEHMLPTYPPNSYKSGFKVLVGLLKNNEKNPLLANCLGESFQAQFIHHATLEQAYFFREMAIYHWLVAAALKCEPAMKIIDQLRQEDDPTFHYVIGNLNWDFFLDDPSACCAEKHIDKTIEHWATASEYGHRIARSKLKTLMNHQNFLVSFRLALFLLVHDSPDMKKLGMTILKQLAHYNYGQAQKLLDQRKANLLDLTMWPELARPSPHTPA